MLLPLLLALASAAPATTPPPSPAQIAQAAGAGEWVPVPDEDLLVMTLAPATGQETVRRVIIQLMPAPVSDGWVANIRRLAAAHWWDGTSINRVQDNYVAQWGDASEKKPLPPGLRTIPASSYTQSWISLATTSSAPPQPIVSWGTGHPADVYARAILWYRGFPLASDGNGDRRNRRVWPVHCYGSVGVGRNLSPDTGSGAELYAVIGHAPRHLDRNIAVAGRVIEGMEHLSSLSRGTGELGFYQDPAQRVAITSVRLASELPAADRPHYAYLSTEGPTWPHYVAARRNREPPFFEKPAGAADVCNIPVPTKAISAAR